ncbi:MAG: FISUMP domain-containing protein [Sphingobacterium hotanense]
MKKRIIGLTVLAIKLTALSMGFVSLKTTHFRTIPTTMQELYAKLIAQNGGNLAQDTPGKNAVAWHKDQDGNLFFSADFGPAGRWMTTNLSAKTYATNTKHSSGRTLELPHGNVYETLDKAFYAYPNFNEGDLTNDSFCKTNTRVGLLYNWDAATAGKGGKSGELHNVGERKINHGKIQGICPQGWHLPNDSEWILLIDEVSENPTKYSIFNSKNEGRAFIDQEPIFKNGKGGTSKSIVDGGFGIMFSGTGDDKAYSLGESASFWTASAAHSAFSTTISREAYAYHISSLGDSGLRENQNKRTHLFSVRCVKD